MDLFAASQTQTMTSIYLRLFGDLESVELCSNKLVINEQKVRIDSVFVSIQSTN